MMDDLNRCSDTRIQLFLSIFGVRWLRERTCDCLYVMMDGGCAEREREYSWFVCLEAFTLAAHCRAL